MVGSFPPMAGHYSNASERIPFRYQQERTMIKLLTSLTRQPAENCIILTYNADLLFFEYMVFDPLYAAGCHNVLVMCDPAQYQLALRDTSQLRHAGQHYPILPARTSPAGAF